MTTAGGPGLGAPLVRLAGVTRIYEMGHTRVPALRGIDLDVRRGEMIAIMGASGSGKSTLMNIIGCLDRPTAGRYELAGRRVDRLSRDDLADLRNRHLGFVFQGFNLLARTSALDNVELPLLYARPAPRDTRARAARALQLVGLGDRLAHDPSELSGGEQQRVAIARALVTRPTLVLADEPTGNLDSRTSIEIMTLFRELNARGITLLVVTHEPDIARFAERLIVLRDGRIIQDEPVPRRRGPPPERRAPRDAEPPVPA
jgi:putative ABC transport system ATP-binding protein